MKSEKKYWNFATTAHRIKSVLAWMIAVALTVFLLYSFTDLKAYF